MAILSNLFNGAILISFLALAQHGCTVSKMAGKAADAHKKGLTSYGAYSRMLTGHKTSWAKPEKAK